MKKKVIITAHDFGLCKSVNDGIIYTLNHKNTIITELSLLPNAPASQEAAQIAKNVPLSVSLNMNFTTFKPLTQAPSLIDKNNYFKKVNVKDWNFSALDNFKDEDINKEIDAQWDWFIKNVGKKPSAILTRKNEFGDPKFLFPIVEKARKEHVAVRTPVWFWEANYGAQSYVEQEKVPATSDVFVGIRGWQGKKGYDLSTDFDLLSKAIQQAKNACELVLFIGFVNEDLFEASTVNWQRGEFLKLLHDDYVMNKIKNTFDLISYRDLLS